MPIYSNNTNDPSLTTALGGVAPAAGDEININQHPTVFATGNAIPFDLLKVLLGPKWYGSFATPFTFKCNQGGTGVVEIRGGSKDFTIGSVATADVHNEVIVKLARSYLLNYTKCTISKLRMYSGRLMVLDDCIATDLLQIDGDVELAGAVGPPTTATLTQKGGSVLNNRIITTALVDGDASFAMDNAAGSVGSLTFAGQLFRWLRGNITTKLTAYRGTIDMSGLKVAPTIANYLIGEGVKIILPPKNILANPFTDATKFIGNGPEFVAAS